MGFRNRLARWLNGGEPLPMPSVNVAEPSRADLLARIEKLELERPAFVLELQNLMETAEEILGRAEKKRGRAAAQESRERRAAEQPEFDPTDREQVKANLRAKKPSWFQ